MMSGGRVARGRHRRARGSARSRVVGAVAAQFAQAMGSFVLQLVAARTLDLADFGVFALLLGAIVVATGVMTGFVGDSLTVLDRRDAGIRAGLQIWCLTVAGSTLVVGGVIAIGTGIVSGGIALLFGAAMAVWVVEDTVRRLLMATMRFWSVVTMDLTHACTALTVLAIVWWNQGALTLADFLLALLVGQSVAIVVGLVSTPAAERGAVSWRGARLGTVAGFGVWRGLQQGIRPATLSGARILVAFAVGNAAVGQMEAARVYVAPALLFVQGIGSFLLAMYAADRRAAVAVALRKADRAAALLLAASVVMGLVATLTVGTLGHLVSGGRYTLDPLTVAGWAAVAASIAAAMPYASLAAVRGRQVMVVVLRLLDATLSTGFVVFILWGVQAGSALVPFGVALGGLLGAVFQRAVVLRTRDPVVPLSLAAH